MSASKDARRIEKMTVDRKLNGWTFRSIARATAQNSCSLVARWISFWGQAHFQGLLLSVLRSASPMQKSALFPGLWNIKSGSVLLPSEMWVNQHIWLWRRPYQQDAGFCLESYLQAGGWMIDSWLLNHMNIQVEACPNRCDSAKNSHHYLLVPFVNLHEPLLHCFGRTHIILLYTQIIKVHPDCRLMPGDSPRISKGSYCLTCSVAAITGFTL